MIKILVLLLVSHQVYSSNILIVGVALSQSHHHWIESIALGLLDKGHNITYLSLDQTQVTHENYTVITLEGLYQLFDNAYQSISFQPITLTPFNIPSYVDFLQNLMLDICKKQLHHSTLHNKLLSYPKHYKFDVILWDNTMGECLYPIIEHFGNPPTIGLSPFGLSNVVENIYGSHVYSFVGNVYMPFAEAATLWQRIINVLFINYSKYRRDAYYKQKSVEMARKVFWDWDDYKFDKTEERFTLVLVNWNYVLNQAQPLSPNVIPIGGVQIKTNESLSQEIKDIFTKPSSGVIFFSLGTSVKTETLSLPILQSFVQCFEELSEYQIIWKIKPPSSLKLPPNLYASPEVPQTSILGQEKTKLFITNGGGLSIHEATHFGVPIVGIPMFLDQNNNIDKLRIKGGGEVVNLVDVNKSKRGKDIFCQKVKKVLYTDSYTRTMKQLSKKYQDQEMSPLDTAVYWVEYVLRHGDARQLSPLSRNMSAFYSLNLDIYLMFILFFVIQLVIVWKVLGLCLRKCCGRCLKTKTA